MTLRQKNYCCVPVPISADRPCCGDELPHLLGRQIFTVSTIRVQHASWWTPMLGPRHRENFPIYGAWPPGRHPSQTRVKSRGGFLNFPILGSSRYSGAHHTSVNRDPG